jgi:MFS family permease
MADGHDPYEALRFPDYRRLLAGNMLASVGTEMQAVAVGWELYERTGSTAALGFVGLAQFLPVFLLSLPAGHAADRYSRKALLVLAMAVTATSSLGLALLSWSQGPVPLVFVCVTLAGVGQALRAPARSALIAHLVPPEALHNAVTWNSSGWQIASMLGPAVGGLAIAVTRRALEAYVLAGACAVVCAVLMVPIRPRPGGIGRQTLSLDSLLAGVRFVWRTKLILATITLDLFAVLLGGATALLPVFVKDILHVGPEWLGWLRAAPSIGALATALLMAHRPPLRRAGPTLLWAVAGFGAATVVFGVSTSPWLSFAALTVTGALDNISVVVRGTLVQLLTPDAMRGRVSAVSMIFISSSNQLGEFESGITADWFGPIWSVVGGGVGTILVVLAAMLRWPQLLRLGALHEVRPEGGDGRVPAPGEPPAPRRPPGDVVGPDGSADSLGAPVAEPGRIPSG